MATFITPTNITPGTSGSWQTVDISSYIPAGSTGVILHIHDPGGASPRDIGWRKYGSSDNRIDDMSSEHFWTAIGCSSDRKVDLYIGNTTTPEIWLVGYFGSEAYFFTNAVDKTPGTLDSWQTVNIASDTGTDTATAAIFEAIQTGWGFGVRKYGSSDNRTNSSGSHIGGIVGVDGSERFGAYLGDATPYQTVKLWLVGYMTAGFTSNTTATNVSLSSTGAWYDISALPAGALGGVIEVSGGFSGDEYGLRKNGTGETIYESMPNNHAIGIVEADTSRIIEGRIANTDTDFFVLGYFISTFTNTEQTSTSKASIHRNTAQTCTAKAMIFLAGSQIVSAKAFIKNPRATVVARGYIGELPDDLAYGIKVSKPTYDVLTDNDPSHFIFDSQYGTLKYHASGTAQLTLDSSVVSNRVQIAHGLGYIPFVEVYTESYESSGLWYYTPFYGYGATTMWTITYSVDDTNINLYAQSGAFLEETDFNVKYFIFKNELIFDQTINVSDGTIVSDVVTI